MDSARTGPFRRPRSWPAGDALLAGALVVGGATAGALAGPQPIWARLVAAGACAGCWAVRYRRTHPLTALLVVVAVELVAAVVNFGLGPVTIFPAVVVCAYSLGAHGSAGEVGAGMTLALPVVAAISGFIRHSAQYSVVSSMVFMTTALIVVPVTVGRIAKARSDLARRLAELGSALRATRGQRIEREVAAERARTARDLEDLVPPALEAIRRHGSATALGDVVALERIARDTLVAMRRVVVDWRDSPALEAPPLSIDELRSRVADTIADQHPDRPVPDIGRRPRSWRIGTTKTLDNALVVVAVVLSVGFGVRTAQHLDASVVGVVLAAAVALPLAAARRAPLAAACAAFALVATFGAVVRPSDPLGGTNDIVIIMVAPFVIGAVSRPRRAAAGLGLCAAGVTVTAIADPGSTLTAIDVCLTTAIALGCWAAGRALGARHHMVENLAATALELEYEQRDLMALAVRDERARVAGELHDAVAHSMTIVALQAAAARRVWDTNPMAADHHRDALRDTLSHTLEELRQLLVTVNLGGPVDDPSGRSSLETLAKRAQRAGLNVDLAVPTDLAPLPPDIEQATYRIIQEALTNAVRHAPGCDVRVAITHDHADVVIEIMNGPSPDPPTGVDSAHHGLRSMHERAARCGGQLSATFAPDGGFGVRASLPLAIR